MRMLIIEDDVDTASYIKRGVEEAGHVADHAADGRDGLLLATTEQYDVLIIDRRIGQVARRDHSPTDGSDGQRQHAAGPRRNGGRSGHYLRRL